MKHFAPLLFLSFFFYSCGSSNNESNQPPVDLNGNWISKDYVETLAENFSPKTTLEKLTFYATEIVINEKNGDSVVIYNGQTGYASLPVERSGDSLRVKLNKDPFTDISYDAETKTLFFIDKSLNRVFRFIRADSSFLDTAFEMPLAFPSLVNNALFEGTWDFFEDNSTQKVVEFTRFGQLKGWDKYNEYTVCINGDCAVNDGGDVVILSNGTDIHAYGFLSKGKELTLFDLVLQPNGKYQLGRAVALLKRKN